MKKVVARNDFLQDHSCSLLWRGLNDMARRDAIREADGEAMIHFWRVDMLDFWSKNHNKYLILGHRLIAGI
jgi:hypothetical protein